MKTILIVENELLVLDYMVKTLLNAGYDVYEAKHGRQALNVIEMLDADLVIVDLVKPEMEGAELINKIKRMNQRDVKIVAMTNGTIIDTCTYLKLTDKSSVDAVLKKPFTTKELLAAIHQTELQVS